MNQCLCACRYDFSDAGGERRVGRPRGHRRVEAFDGAARRPPAPRAHKARDGRREGPAAGGTGGRECE